MVRARRKACKIDTSIGDKPGGCLDEVAEQGPGAWLQGKPLAYPSLPDTLSTQMFINTKSNAILIS